ncbi:hypothetical protein ACJIZ3_007168 [Penstemon smallii]|uniref:Uncharacterized protein n=1 Tax=Penstemon smallii TaxID=265156 RepID=A0ABD3SA98_9LAMI
MTSGFPLYAKHQDKIVTILRNIRAGEKTDDGCLMGYKALGPLKIYCIRDS